MNVSITANLRRRADYMQLQTNKTQTVKKAPPRLLLKSRMKS